MTNLAKSDIIDAEIISRQWNIDPKIVETIANHMTAIIIRKISDHGNNKGKWGISLDKYQIAEYFHLPVDLIIEVSKIIEQNPRKYFGNLIGNFKVNL
ncbi:MAG: hypothetical protein WA061_01995 [Microgenomates group bacterium]